MAEDNLVPCFLCQRRSSHGKHFTAWSMTICQTCYHTNWDGAIPRTWPHLLPYLEENGYRIEYGESGSIRWPAKSVIPSG
jgi:hypothetical protein